MEEWLPKLHAKRARRTETCPLEWTSAAGCLYDRPTRNSPLFNRIHIISGSGRRCNNESGAARTPGDVRRRPTPLTHHLASSRSVAISSPRERPGIRAPELAFDFHQLSRALPFPRNRSSQPACFNDEHARPGASRIDRPVHLPQGLPHEWSVYPLGADANELR